MPWFSSKSGEDKQRQEELRSHAIAADADRMASVEALEAGGIPVQAQRRLDDIRSHAGTFFTSDLTVNEFLLTRQAGFRPLSQVMGSSVFHVGWQQLPGSTWRMWTQNAELTVISNAMNQARSFALGRLEQEAKLLGAHAVVGVHIERGQYDWASGMMEFQCVGTAVRLIGDDTPRERPALTNLSGQDFWKLYQAGHWPLGVVAGSTAYYVVGNWLQSMKYSWGGRWQNMELPDFTHGLNVARHIATGQIHSQAAHLGAKGVVGMQIEQREEEHEVSLGNDQERTDMIFTFHAIGTAITDRPSMPNAESGQRVQATVSLD